MRLLSDVEPVIWALMALGKRRLEVVSRRVGEGETFSDGPWLLGRTGEVDLSRDT